MCGNCRKNNSCCSEKYDPCKKRCDWDDDCCDPCPQVCRPACPAPYPYPVPPGPTIAFDALKQLIINTLVNALNTSTTIATLNTLPPASLGNQLIALITSAINLIPNTNQTTPTLIGQITSAIAGVIATLSGVQANINAGAVPTLNIVLSQLNGALPAFAAYVITPPLPVPQPYYIQSCYRSCCY
jgi:hypothetical protein